MFENYKAESIYELMLVINCLMICSQKLGPEYSRRA